jgi:hypothetical protein
VRFALWPGTIAKSADETNCLFRVTASRIKRRFASGKVFGESPTSETASETTTQLARRSKTVDISSKADARWETSFAVKLIDGWVALDPVATAIVCRWFRAAKKTKSAPTRSDAAIDEIAGRLHGLTQPVREIRPVSNAPQPSRGTGSLIDSRLDPNASASEIRSKSAIAAWQAAHVCT